MLNIELLEQKIKSSGLKNEFIADELGLSRTAYYKRKQGLSNFRKLEIEKMCYLLKIDDDKERVSIFFAPNVNG